MPRPKKRARSSPKSNLPIDVDAADDDDNYEDNDNDVDEAVSPVCKSRRTITNPIATNGVKVESSPTRSLRGKKNENVEVNVKIEDEDRMNGNDGDGENEQAQEEQTEDYQEEEDEDEEEKEEIFECPTCKKRFTSKYGRKYHVDNNVCQPRNRIKKAKIEIPTPASFDEEFNGDDGGGENAQAEKEQEEEEEIFECPTCKKRFTSKYGRKYHVDNMVCQPKKRIKEAKIERSAPTSFDDEVVIPGGRRKASLRATKKIMSLTKCQKSDIDSDDDEDGAGGNGENSDKEFIAENGGVKSDDELVADEDDEEEDDEEVEPKRRNRGKSRRTSERQSYTICDLGVLEKGSRFVTKFGVVEVISDDRTPENNTESSIAATATPQTVRTYLNRQARFRERYDRVINDIAAGTRYRREELAKMYAASKLSKSAPAGTFVLSQEKVWNLYCKSLTLKQIMVDGFSSTAEKEGNVEAFLDEDPRFPTDLYPHRIVECKLVEDERDHIVVSAGGNFEKEDDDEEGANGLEYHVKERPPTPAQIASMRLYIARKELTQEYDAAMPCYVCKICSKSKNHRDSMKYHLSNSLCWIDKDEEKEERLKQIKSIESKAISGTGCRDSLLNRLHGVVEDGKRRGDPMFGNPHRIKEFKKHKLPPWLVFNEQRSSMYPEIYVSLGFKRGSQNRNYFNKIKQQDGYVPKPDKTRLRKRLKKLKMCYQSETLAPIPVPSNPTNQPVTTDKKKNAARKSVKAWASDLPPSLPPFPFGSPDDLPPALPPLPTIDSHHEMDFGFDNNGMTDDNVFEDTPDSTYFNETDWNPSIDNDETTPESSSATHDKNSRRRKQVVINKEKPYYVVDTQVLAAECDSGRYPTINRYNGDHVMQCTICNESDDVPLINCDYCKNSVHQLCLDKRMLGKDPQVIIRENEPDDTPMCHVCISTCLFRRWRAENRRSMKWQNEISKAGLGGVPEAANLREEVRLKDDNLRDSDLGKPTHEPCPDGGPGGLICCPYCTAAYSRFLSNTAKEMEAQSVSRVGQEVSEILELLADAKQRLQRASSVSQSNEDRRSLLDINQSAQN